MNKYPGIYKALGGTIYYYLNKKKFFSPHRGRWEEDCDNDDHKTDVNITAEYLANTYGKVENKEHAEFIVKLAESAGFYCGEFNNFRDGYFFSIGDNILLFVTDESKAKNQGEKLITIPLPPKDKSMESQMPNFNAEKPMPEIKEPKKVSMNDIQINVNNNTDSVVQVTKSDDESNIFIHVNDLPKSEEWPQVGDEVLIDSTEHLSELGNFNGEKCKVIGICEHKGKNVLTLTHNSLGVAALIMGEWIKEPPTPEEELESQLRVLMSADSCGSYKDLAKAIINGEIEGLEYKP